MRICSLRGHRLKQEWNQMVWSVNNLRCGTAVESQRVWNRRYGAGPVFPQLARVVSVCHARILIVTLPVALDLSVSVGALRLANPIIAASGTFGYGLEFAHLVDLNQLGVIVVKGLSH